MGGQSVRLQDTVGVPPAHIASSGVKQRMWRNKVVVITGASAGIGRATARAFGGAGAAVALLARGRNGLEAAKREIEASGSRAVVIPTDVADARQVEAAADQIERELGPIDV